MFLAFKNCYTISEMPESDTDCEIIWANVKLKGSKHMYIGSFYRPPNSNIETLKELEKSIINLPKNSDNQHIVLGGDFNLPDINWNDACVTRGSKRAVIHQQLLDIASDHMLENIQKEPTREKNVVDLYFTNNTSLVKYSQTLPGISDHEMIIIDSDIKPQYKKQIPRKVYSYK